MSYRTFEQAGSFTRLFLGFTMDGHVLRRQRRPKAGHLQRSENLQ
jgi:hypothetical protein